MCCNYNSVFYLCNILFGQLTLHREKQTMIIYRISFNVKCRLKPYHMPINKNLLERKLVDWLGRSIRENNWLNRSFYPSSINCCSKIIKFWEHSTHMLQSESSPNARIVHAYYSTTGSNREALLLTHIYIQKMRLNLCFHKFPSVGKQRG